MVTGMIEAPAQVGIAEPLVVAIDNGGTNTRIALRQGESTIGSSEYETPTNYDVAVGAIGRNVDILNRDKQPIQAIGFAVAGKVAEGKITNAGQLEEYGWCGRPFSIDIADELAFDPGYIVLMNDCVAAAKAQQVANRKVGGPISGFVETISTGFGGALFIGDELIGKEPGHDYLKPGAICGCGKEGCAEAHISGSGIERKFGIKGEDLPEEMWPEIIADTVEAHRQLLQRLSAEGYQPRSLYFFGSVALKSPYLLAGLRQGMAALKDQLVYLPGIREATHRDNSGLVGAGDAAIELALSA